MNIPMPFVPAKRRVRRKRRTVGPLIPGTEGPVLTGATYLGGTWVQLTFDRPVTAPESLTAGAVVVDDGPGSAQKWTGVTVMVISPTKLEVWVTSYGPSDGTAVTLTTTDATGIVAADGGAAWEGVTGVGLPFGGE